MARVEDTKKNVIVLTVIILVAVLGHDGTFLDAALKLTRTTIVAVFSLIVFVLTVIVVRIFLTSDTLVGHTDNGGSQGSRQRRGQ